MLNLVHSAFFLVPSKGVTKNFLTKDPNIGNQQSIAIMFKGVLLAASVATASAFSGATLPVRGNVARKLPCFLFLFLRPVGTVLLSCRGLLRVTSGGDPKWQTDSEHTRDDRCHMSGICRACDVARCSAP